MADDRPAGDDLTAVVATLRRELDDLKTTALARMSRSPTGTIQQTLRTTPLPDTLFLQGQTLTRADYPAFWQWVEDQGLAGSGKPFGTGNGSTTFVLPDFRGRVPMGAGPLGPDNSAVGTAVGSSRVSLSIAQMPAHNHGSVGDHSHNVSVNDAPNHTHYVNSADNHTHYFQTNTTGSHGGHVTSAVTRVGGADLAAHPTTASGGNHSHDGYTANAGGHDHGYTSNSGGHGHNGSATNGGGHSHATQGSGSTIDARPPSIAVNWMIYV